MLHLAIALLTPAPPPGDVDVFRWIGRLSVPVVLLLVGTRLLTRSRRGEVERRAAGVVVVSLSGLLLLGSCAAAVGVT